MKKLLVFTLAFLFGIPLSFAQETVPSQIKEVTLFTNQALVKREAKANLRKGLNEILIELQAFQVDRDSVTAKLPPMDSSTMPRKIKRPVRPTLNREPEQLCSLLLDQEIQRRRFYVGTRAN